MKQIVAVPGSHNKKLSDEEINLITQNGIPYICDLAACDIQIMNLFYFILLQNLQVKRAYHVRDITEVVQGML